MIPFISSSQNLVVPPLVSLFSSSSASHAFGLSSKGLLYATGKNNGYHLGIGHDTSINTWRLISLYGVKQVACGGGFTLAVKKNGELWGCGQNNYGQLGISLDIPEVKEWIKLRDGVKFAAAGRGHAMIITDLNELMACGDNRSGQLGTGDTINRAEWTKVMDNVIDVSCGDSHTGCITQNQYGTSGHVTGDNTYYQLGMPFVMEGHFTVVLNASPSQVSCGSRHTLFCTSDGKLFGCGDNRKGQVGMASNEEYIKSLSLHPSLKDVKSAYCGGSFSLLIKTDGTLLAAGDNSLGQIGLGKSLPSINQFAILAAIPDTTTTVTAGNTTSYCSTHDVTYATGDNYIGQIGNGENVDMFTWTQIILS